ncbi:septum formation protein Maf [bacterium]|nr:septum formation protein Maf [bacterium]
MPKFPERFILASGSPRRKMMLELLKVPFEVRVPKVEESIVGAEEPIALVARLAKEKAMAVAHEIKDPKETTVIVGCDTIVVLGKEILGKPKDIYEAYAMLTKLQGRTHMVYSGLALVKLENGREEAISNFCATEVTMCKLSLDEIKRYFELENPLDKAGAYAIQDGGSLIISSIDGCYYNVLGFPVRTLEELMRQWGYSLFL